MKLSCCTLLGMYKTLQVVIRSAFYKEYNYFSKLTFTYLRHLNKILKKIGFGIIFLHAIIFFINLCT